MRDECSVLSAGTITNGRGTASAGIRCRRVQHSWLYLIQACRGALGPLGGYYRDDDFFVGL
jgi:hypothetical protein